MFVEPLAAWREVHVHPTKTALDWAGRVKRLVDHPRLAQAERNERQTGIDWQFTTDDARRKLKRLYPKIELRQTTSASANFNLRVQVLELDSCILDGELPVDTALLFSGGFCPSR